MGLMFRESMDVREPGWPHSQGGEVPNSFQGATIVAWLRRRDGRARDFSAPRGHVALPFVASVSL